jgi:hypothetical protein
MVSIIPLSKEEVIKKVGQEMVWGSATASKPCLILGFHLSPVIFPF